MKMVKLEYRIASLDDIPLLARMNRQLVEDEKHRNRFKSDAWLEDRMKRFISGDYTGVLFNRDGNTLAYALYTTHKDHPDTIYLRQIFVAREHRRQGIGRAVIKILKDKIWPKDKRITVGVLVGNKVARDFYKAVGFKEYCLELEINPGI
jgi:GNAT superfamily N-acetyltransferase